MIPLDWLARFPIDGNQFDTLAPSPVDEFVFFHPIPKDGLFIGGQVANEFVRVTIDLIARSIDDPEMQQQFLVGCSRVLEPYVAGRGYRWELHVDDTPFDLWMIEGLKPPHPGTPAELKWRSENRPSTY